MLNYMTLSDEYPVHGSFYAVAHKILCAVALVFYFFNRFLSMGKPFLSSKPSQAKPLAIDGDVNKHEVYIFIELKKKIAC